MPKHAVILILGSVLTTSATIAATSSGGSGSTRQETAVRAQPAPVLIFPAAQRDPYAQLFTSKRAGRITTAHQASAPTPAVSDGRIVCGMKVIPVDPSVDRKMIIPIPPQAAKTSRIRVVEPPCDRQ